MSITSAIEAYARSYSIISGNIEQLEAEVSRLKAAREKLLTDDMVSYMQENGLAMAKLENGSIVEIKKIYDVKAKDKTTLADWLRANSLGAIITDSVDFAKGEVDHDLLTFLDTRGYRYDLEETIHPQSLKKAIREHIEEGGELPPIEAAAVAVFDRVEIKAPKE